VTFLYTQSRLGLAVDELAQPAERAVISLAVRVGKTRLIDNVLLGIRLEEIA